MSDIMDRPGIYTDYYELTMAQGYFLSGRADDVASFDYFFRDNPFDGGYVVFAGLSDLLQTLENFTFNKEELDYLSSLGFRDEFISYLEHFEFSADIYACPEGEVVFPGEPILRVDGNIIEAQLIETIVLNLLNFESLIATKAARIRQSAGEKLVADFGLRRAQGYGGIQASKASIIGGVNSTSNVYSAFQYGLNATGTMAHSWIQSFDSELHAFRKFAEYYPDNCVLLVDTYDTLNSGVPNAIKVAKEMEERGEELLGIRLDSGDLAYFARESRKLLDEAGLDYVKIAASNQLDEYIVKSLIDQGAPIDLFGIGTRLVTGDDSPALDGVYKLNSIGETPKLKISENIEKITLPGRKRVERYIDDNGYFYGDGIKLHEEENINKIIHPHFPGKTSEVWKFDSEELLQPFMEKGEIRKRLPDAEACASYVNKRLKKLPDEHKRFANPHVYKVGISKKLELLRDNLISKEKV